MRKFYTFIKKEHKLGDRLYVHGRIHGFMTLICEEDQGVPSGVGVFGSGTIFVTKTTEEKYAKFKEVVEKHYPGLCEFDVEVEKLEASE